MARPVRRGLVETARMPPAAARTRKPTGVAMSVRSSVLYQGSEPLGVS